VDTESFEHRQQPIFGRQPSEYLVFVVRRRMTEQHLAQPDNLGSTRHRPSGQQLLEQRVHLLGLPAKDGLGIGWGGAILGPLRSDKLGERGHFAIALNELDRDIEIVEIRERFAHHRTGEHVTTNELWSTSA
jgi:hypothetical protein